MFTWIRLKHLDNAIVQALTYQFVYLVNEVEILTITLSLPHSYKLKLNTKIFNFGAKLLVVHYF
jgi:hypothetical protein